MTTKHKLYFDELKASGELPSPKGVALAVMDMFKRENLALPELAHTILADPALAGRIIKMANSINPNRNRPIASVTVDTLILIGIQATRQAVLALSLVMSYRKGKCKGFDYHNFWAHSLAMACVAQTVGAVVRTAPLSEVFVCGLLAEVGQLGLAAARPGEYSELLEQYADKPLNEQLRAESELFGMNHCQLTASMMEDWGIPRLFIDAVSFYHDPGASGFAQGSRSQNLVLALQLAAQLADFFTAPDHARAAMSPRIFEVGAALDLDAEHVAAIANHAAQDWLEWGELLNIRMVAVPHLDVPNPDAGGGTQKTGEADSGSEHP